MKDDPLWYKDAVFYELRVRSLYDSDGDGIGDFRGLSAKLDYFKELGVTTLWLLPFYPSPMRDDGYDTADYLDVHPDCGTLQDFRVFLREAKRRNLRVVTELVLNHTSDQHPWFQRARRAAPGSNHRDFYVWSDTQERYQEARIIFKDFELSNWTWDPLAKAYYWHRFYAHQPDLNLENPAVRRALMRVVDFWFNLGVDGLRLDAVPYLYERDGTNCENLPETHAFIKDLRRHIDQNFADKMLLAEANQWPEDAVTYLDQGKECHMAFHFPLMPRLFMAVRTEDRFPLTDIWSQTPSIDESCQWALFLRNHDELTLEMVTDEERDYMYRAYAHENRMRINLGIRRRLAPLLGNNRRTIELMNGLLFSLPGTPVIYYGDEIGMGDNVYLGDRDGVRTPMQWSADMNAGFSRCNPQKLILPVVIDHEYHYQTINVEAQEENRHSLLWWMRRLIALRKQFRAFGRGSIEFLHPDNHRILAFIRSEGASHILVVANLSRFVQHVELDLAKYKGFSMTELFGRSAFPVVTERPYSLSLASHVFYWFSLDATHAPELLTDLGDETRITITGDFASLVSVSVNTNVGTGASVSGAGGTNRAALDELLPTYLMRCDWFGAKGKVPKLAHVIETIPLADDANPCICLVHVEYAEGEPERYVMPLSFVTKAEAHEIEKHAPRRILARLTLLKKSGEESGLLCDAFADPAFGRAVLDLAERRKRVRGAQGELVATATRAFRKLRGSLEEVAAPVALHEGAPSSTLVYDQRLVFKLFRRLEEGENPDLEVGRHLLEQCSHALPELAAGLEYLADRKEPITLGVMRAFVPHQEDAEQYTVEELKRFFERAVTKRDWGHVAPPKPLSALLADEPPPEGITNMIGAYLDAARLLGTRTGELHRALTAGADAAEFAAEPYSTLYQRSMYQSMRNVAGRVFRRLKADMATLPELAREGAAWILERQHSVVAIFDAFLRHPVEENRVRCHGNLTLSEFLYTGKDFVIANCEGDPRRPLSDRRRKRSALRDIASMSRSFHYVSLCVLTDQVQMGALGERDFRSVEPFADLWHSWSLWSYLQGYLDASKRTPLTARSRMELAILLDAFRLERALLELEDELLQQREHDRERAHVPLRGIAHLLAHASSAHVSG